MRTYDCEPSIPGVIPGYLATGATPRCLNFGEKLSAKLTWGLAATHNSSDETSSARLSERRADLCNPNQKEPRMSRNILEALLYAALAIVHFMR